MCTHALGVVILIHDSCYLLGTTIQAEKHQQLKFVTFITSFSHSKVCGSKYDKYIYFLIWREKSQPFLLLIHIRFMYPKRSKQCLIKNNSSLILR